MIALDTSRITMALVRLQEAVTYKKLARASDPYGRAIEREAARFFRRQGLAFAKAFAGLPLQEAAIDDIFDRSVAGIDLGALATAIAKCYVGGMAFAGAEYQLGISFTLKNPRAVAYQETRGVELLAELNKTTKAEINRIIADGLEAGSSYEVIAREIKKRFVSYGAKAKGPKHARNRAQLVAITEKARAYSAGNYGAILDATGTGLAFQKSWYTANDRRVDPHCKANQDQGWIGMADLHSSGALYPPDHPGCRCVELYQRDPAMQPQLDRIVYNAEKNIKDQAYESAYIFNQAGAQLLFKDGTRSEVQFTDPEVALLNNAIITHNHPSIGGSFSPADVALAITHNTAEMRAVGAKYRYSLKFPEGSIKKYFQNQVDSVSADVRKDFTQKIRNGEMSVQEAEIEHWHAVWLRFAKTHRWEYERTEW